MKLHPIIVLVTFFYATVLPAQTINNRPFQASIGLVSSNIDRYDPYTGNRQVKQIAFQAAWEPFKEATWGTNNFISIRSIISPKKDGNEGVEYGFLGLGVGLNHYSDSRRWFIALSFDLRHETYVSHAAYGIILGPGNPSTILLSPEVRGTMIRPWLSASFTYSGTLVPYLIRKQWQPITRFEFGRAFATPASTGSEDSFRKHSEELQGAFYLGLKF